MDRSIFHSCALALVAILCAGCGSEAPALALVDASTPDASVSDASPGGGDPDTARPDAGSTGDGGVECRAGTVACGDDCVDLSTDPRHCGSCEKDCTQLANVDADAVHCTSGKCDVKDACLANHAHCSAEPSDGCETDLTLPTHCGDCATACADPTPTCSPVGDGSYACASGCNPPTASSCGGTCVDVTTNPAHCGGCDKACPAPANSLAKCEGSTCSSTCKTDFADCNAKPADGCETDLTLPTHCGDCGTACADPTPMCSAGGDGSYACASGCNPPTASSCGGTCVDLTTNPAHCGGCDKACPAPANSVAKCAGSKCSSTCKTGFADCNAKPADGCEIDTTKDIANCGSCGKACTGGTTCVQGACVCPGGLTNCGGVCKACCPNCAGRTCGSDGCGGTCGTCDACSVCNNAFGICTPDGTSNGRTCGGGTGRCCAGGGCIKPCLPSGTACVVGVCSLTHCAGCCNGTSPGGSGFVCN